MFQIYHWGYDDNSDTKENMKIRRHKYVKEALTHTPEVNNNLED